jgi:hypothetical protein
MKFLVTNELGRLSKWLRLLGFDTVYADKKITRSSLLISALCESRLIITRQENLGKHLAIKIVHIDSPTIEKQLPELIKKLNLKISPELMFTRCLHCNWILQDIDKSKLRLKVPAYVYKSQQRFIQCPACHKVFWAGTHRKSALYYLDKIIQYN